jgi:RecJ-like exonuclease
MDLSVAIRSAAEKVGGVGGGHNIAAGATIPEKRKEEFLDALDSIVGNQLTSRGQRRG